MAFGMLGAAMASGMGQGLANASSTGMQLVGASMLQRERADMENKRLAIMEQYASAREQRGYQHQDETLAKTQEFQRGMEQERRGAEVVLRSQERDAQSKEKEADRELSRGQHAAADETTRRGQDITQEHGKDVLAATISHNKATEAHQKALENIYRAHYANERDKVKSFITDEKGTYFALTESGETKPIINPITKEPITGTKGLSEASKALASLHKERGDAFYKLAGDAMASPDDKARYQQLGEEAYRQAGTYLGEKPSKPSGSVQIKDRFASSSAPAGIDAKSPGEPPAPKPRPDKIVPATPSLSPSAGPTDALSFGFDKAKEGIGMLADKAKDAIMPQASASSSPIVRESKDQALAAVTRGSQTPETFLADKQAEAEQRASVVQAKPPVQASGLLGMANASVPPTVTPKRDAPKASARTSGMDWAESLPPADQQLLRKIIAEYQDGKRTRDEFISGVISLSDNGTQGLAIAEGMLRNLDRGAK